MIEKVIPFYTPIYASMTNIDLNEAIDKILAIKDTKPSINASNKNGGYHTAVIKQEEFAKEFPSIYQEVMDRLFAISKDIQIDLSFSGAWAMVNKKDAFNMPHVHPHETFCAVLYLQTPNKCGNLVFKNPTSSSHYPINDNKDGFYGTHTITPAKGLICFFPAYLEHYVEHNQSNEDRISIAFNFLQV
jgi:uncharacterized protein (TIGR02466 family)